MPVFKNLMSAIFNKDENDEDLDEYEEYEEYEDDDEDYVEEEEYEVDNSNYGYVEPQPQPQIQPQPVYVQPEPVVQDPQYLHPRPTQLSEASYKKTSSFVEISADDPNEAYAPKPKKKVAKASTKASTKVPARSNPTVEYDYSPVISPIFGNVADEKKEFNKVHNAIELKKPEEESFNKIISPMYGNDIPVAKRRIPAMDVDQQITLTLDDMLEEDVEESVSQQELFKTEE